jgi:hypothetical protein
MAVVQATIKAALLAVYNEAKAAPMSEADFADKIATVISDAILSATVTGTATGVTPGGASVPVTGTLS